MKADGHICSVAVSKDGRWIVTGDQGKKAVLWNAATHEKMREFTEHGHYVYAVDISSDGAKIATADYLNAQVFSIASGDRLLPPLLHLSVVGVKFSPYDSRFATVSTNNGFRIYSTLNGNILFDSSKRGSTRTELVVPLAWSSDGQQLFVANIGKIICFGFSKSLFSEWSTHDDKHVVSMAFNDRFIACGALFLLSLWDCISRKQISSIIKCSTAINCVALSPGGRYLACGLYNGEFIIYNLKYVLPPEYLDRNESFHPLMELTLLTVIMPFLCPA